MTTPSPAPARHRQPSAATRWLKQAREMRILAALKRGASLTSIARQEGLSQRRLRDIVNALIAAREDLAPADGLAQLRAYHLNRTLDAAFDVVRSGSGSAAALGQILKILRDFERNPEIGSA